MRLSPSIKKRILLLSIAFAMLAALTAAAFSQTGERIRGLLRDFKYVANVRYAEGGGKYHLLDVFAPRIVPDSPMPVVVYIHGGGWRRGDKISGKTFMAALAEAGFIVVSINYRLAPDSKWPAQIEDCKAAIRWVRKNIASYGGDPRRIGVFGLSAGGHLAALLGTSGGVAALEGDLGERNMSSRVDAVCDWFGPSDFTILGRRASKEHKGILEGFLGGKLDEVRDRAIAASPVTYIDRDDPPFLIIHGDSDPLVPVEQSERLHGLLAEAGVESELIVVPGGKHGDFRGTHPDGRELTALMVEFFEKHLK